MNFEGLFVDITTYTYIFKAIVLVFIVCCVGKMKRTKEKETRRKRGGGSDLMFADCVLCACALGACVYVSFYYCYLLVCVSVCRGGLLASRHPMRESGNVLF